MKQHVNGLEIAMVQMAIASAPLANANRFLAEARRAVAEGAEIVVGSEMMLSHYLSGDQYEDEGFIDDMWAAVGYIADESKDIDAVLIFGGIALDDHPEVGEDGRVRKYNAAFVVHKGMLVCNGAGMPFAVKSLMPNYRIFDDSRHFYDLRKVASERGVQLKDLQKPFTVLIRNHPVSLGVMLCEDMWDQDYAEKPAKNLADNGADILINLSCSPWSWNKNQKRDSVIRSICKATGLPFLYVNNVGMQNNGKNLVVFDGASTLYNTHGDIVAMSERYVEATDTVTLYRGRQSLARHDTSDVAEMFKAITVATVGFLKTLPASVRQKVVVGVSGGMDSALTVAFFAHVLGPEWVIAVNMPYGSFNSKETRDDAAELARRLDVEYRVIPIDAMVDARCAVTGIKPGSAQHKTMQAIERMNVLAAVASQENGFFTCNANWTETAFGYGTLNGDMRGTFAPWINCLKQDVYRLGVHLNEVVYGREIIPQSIIDRPPMDELTAEGVGERGDPFDYGNATENGYHDQMVRAIVSFRQSAEWFLKQYQNGTLESELRLTEGGLKQLFPTAEDFVEDLERCFNLFHAALFKRVQSVPGPLVDKRSFGWDLRESVLPWVKTTRFERLKAEVLTRQVEVA